MTRLQRLLLGLNRRLAASGLLEKPWVQRLWLLLYDFYKARLEAPGTAHLAELVTPGSLVLDIGANVGFFARRFADWAGPEGLVVAVEPGPDNLVRLSLLPARRGAAPIRVLAAACAEAPGTRRLKLDAGNPMDHKLATGAAAGSEGLTVGATTVDALVARHAAGRPLSLVKIDVQGAESLVLDGAAETLASHRPALLVEVTDGALRAYGASAGALLARLRDHGYRLSIPDRAGLGEPLDDAAILARAGGPDGYCDVLARPAGDPAR
ncbi:FkbM family methyltransferase [Roseospirillum parvum]|uniref:Methyltransferase, FkbM family n=1 Tax=Roseospirillum parvum TaxID=83401 RepID=A0A1G7W3F7_9PROT|nr:FkbM family methyltransferase [Roseospirillum parvum]SDG66467.1 methyltransferase, FkbM family [Roseospirillum parvum]